MTEVECDPVHKCERTHGSNSQSVGFGQVLCRTQRDRAPVNPWLLISTIYLFLKMNEYRMSSLFNSVFLSTAQIIGPCKREEEGKMMFPFYFSKNNLRFIFYCSVEKHRFCKICLSLLVLLIVVYTSRNCRVRQFWPTCFNYNTIKTKNLTSQQPVKLNITSISRVGK